MGTSVRQPLSYSFIDYFDVRSYIRTNVLLVDCLVLFFCLLPEISDVGKNWWHFSGGFKRNKPNIISEYLVWTVKTIFGSKSSIYNLIHSDLVRG